MCSSTTTTRSSPWRSRTAPTGDSLRPADSTLEVLASVRARLATGLSIFSCACRHLDPASPSTMPRGHGCASPRTPAAVPRVRLRPSRLFMPSHRRSAILLGCGLVLTSSADYALAVDAVQHFAIRHGVLKRSAALTCRVRLSASAQKPVTSHPRCAFARLQHNHGHFATWSM
jgi:hypothetical protein